MIISELQPVSDRDLEKYAWAGLRRFQNASFVAGQIMRRHSLPEATRSNAHKQATQIRYCLLQAKEYYDAGVSASLATSPNLFYYSAMSLALAEILFKQDGMSSLDKARENNRHHGLELKIDRLPAIGSELHLSGGALQARPSSRSNGERFGTFDLWHRSCREMPLVGKITTQHKGTGATTGYSVVLVSADERLPLVPTTGLSLSTCLASMPGLEGLVRDLGLEPILIRGAIDRTVSSRDGSESFELIIHPASEGTLTAFLDNLMFEPSAVNRLQILELPSGVGVKWIHSPKLGQISVRFPSSSMWTKRDVRFWPCDQPLNEFGFMYVALYIAGNYARYFPDRWLADVEHSSPLALAIEQLVSVVKERMPLLALSELTQRYQLPDS